MAFVELKLSGLDGVLKTLQSLPAEIVSKNGGPVREALRRAAQVLVTQAKANLQSVSNNATSDGKAYSTGLAAQSVRAIRKNLPQGVNGELYRVGVRRAIYSSGNKFRGRKLATSDTAWFLEYGTAHQPAEPWLRPAVQTKGAEVIQTFERELRDGIDRVVQKLARGA